MLSKALTTAAAGSGAETDEYFNQTTLLLHGDGTNGAQNNTFLDSSTNNFTITRNGNTTQGTFSPFSNAAGEWSNYFDGSGDNLTVGPSTDLAMEAGDFTAEGFVYLPSLPVTDTGIFMLSGATTAPLNAAIQLGIIGASKSWFVTSNNSATVGAATATAGQWYHFAIVRNSGTIDLYINGTSVLSVTDTTNYSGQYAAIGYYYNSTYDVLGYISNFRVIKGTALYTSAFTPPTAPLTAISGTELLTCQSNRFKDNSTNNFAITPAGNVAVQPLSPFAPSAAYDPSVNGGSGYFDGSGDYLTTPSNSAFDFGTGDFTIEFWAYKNVATNNMALVGTRTGDSSISIRLSTYVSSTGYFECDVWDTSGARMFNFAHQTLFIPGTWNHCALVRNGTSFYLYFNGVQSTSSGTSSAAVANSSLVFRVGDFDTSSLIDFNGYISSLRVIKGTALYTSGFTPPTAPVTAISGTSLLTNFTNAGIYDNTGKNNLETVGNAQIDTTTKKYGTGSMEFDGASDWLQIPASSNLEVGTGNFTVEFWGYWSSIGNIAILFGWAGGATNKTFAYTYSDGRIAIGINTVNEISSTAGQITTGSWIHIAYVKNGSTTTIYKNGTSIASNTTAVWYSSTGTESFYIAGSADVSDSAVYIDDLRITKGVARYTANFTPPTKAFPNQ